MKRVIIVGCRRRRAVERITFCDDQRIHSSLRKQSFKILFVKRRWTRLLFYCCRWNAANIAIIDQTPSQSQHQAKQVAFYCFFPEDFSLRCFNAIVYWLFPPVAVRACHFVKQQPSLSSLALCVVVTPSEEEELKTFQRWRSGEEHFGERRKEKRPANKVDFFGEMIAIDCQMEISLTGDLRRLRSLLQCTNHSFLVPLSLARRRLLNYVFTFLFFTVIE